MDKCEVLKCATHLQVDSNSEIKHPTDGRRGSHGRPRPSAVRFRFPGPGFVNFWLAEDRVANEIFTFAC